MEHAHPNNRLKKPRGGGGGGGGGEEEEASSYTASGGGRGLRCASRRWECVIEIGSSEAKGEARGDGGGGKLSGKGDGGEARGDGGGGMYVDGGGEETTGDGDGGEWARRRTRAMGDSDGGGAAEGVGDGDGGGGVSTGSGGGSAEAGGSEEEVDLAGRQPVHAAHNLYVAQVLATPSCANLLAHHLAHTLESCARALASAACTDARGGVALGGAARGGAADDAPGGEAVRYGGGATLLGLEERCC